MNYTMINDVQMGKALDISKYPRTPEGYYILPNKTFDNHDAGMDYCDLKTEQWIWSIGLHNKTQVFHASLKADLFDNSEYSCVWMR